MHTSHAAVREQTRFLFWPLAILLLANAASVWAEAPVEAEACASCHGEKGISRDGDIPIIAGASNFFLENQLFLFRDKGRPCAGELFSQRAESPPKPDHCALAADWSDDDIAKIAGYFSALPHQSAEQSFDTELAQIGKAIHERSCDRCHAEGGSLALDDAGILAGQWRPYLIRTLESFRAGERWQEEKMADATAKLSDDDIKALAEYYVSVGQ
ncbi:cytochrome c553 [Marinimicrobium koreense]|uniref:Cytochrome c553 n=1 Tax=Marinimicrobium koreense TaxID=306545 RepID=A0A3N1NX35_9GAMM|nr:c-type cytochrome [Marinimicrobium koreense]ROQ20733.1 cytochrome c553 [Marinimicrobium koreense]